MSNQFIARNDRYPQFSFACSGLRPFLDKRGEKMTSTVVRFENGVLDTKAQGWSDQEAAVIRKKLDSLQETMVRLTFNEEGVQTDAEPVTLPLKTKG